MSVIKFKREFFGRIGESIRIHREFGTTILKNLVLNDAEKLLRVITTGQHEISEKDVYCFVDRLFYANQMAFEYSYAQGEESFTIERLSEEDFKTMPFGASKEFLSEIRSLRYNLYSNGGNCFLGTEDMKKLDSMINILTNYCYNELKRAKAKSQTKFWKGVS